MNNSRGVMQSNNRVTKSNSMIQKARFDLSATEQKILLAMISMLNPKDTEFQFYNFSIHQFSELCGIKYKENLSDLKAIIEGFMSKYFWIDKNTCVHWVDTVKLIPNSDIVSFRLNSELKPYLLDLQKFFTTYELLYILTMKRKYSIRLYEIFKSYQYKGNYTETLETLKKLLNAEHYNQYSDFKKYVILPSIEEINLLTDIAIEFNPIKTGRQVTSLSFNIVYKNNLDDRMRAWVEIEHRTTGKQQIKGQLMLNLEDKEV